MNPNRLFCGALLALALVASQAVHAEDKTVTLERKFKKDAVTRYESTVNATLMGMEIHIKNKSKQTVKEVKENGNVVIESVDESGTIKIGEMPEQEIPATPPVTETRDKRGRLIDFKTEPPAQEIITPEVTRLLSALSDAFLPEKPVKEGDTWEVTFDNPAVKDKKVTVKSKYLGIEKVGGVELWKIKQTTEADANADGAKITSDATIWLHPKDGQVQKVEAKIHGIPSVAGELNTETNMKRLPDEKEPKADPAK